MQYSSVDYMLVMSVASAIVSDQIYFISVSLSAEFTLARRRLSLVRAARGHNHVYRYFNCYPSSPLVCVWYRVRTTVVCSVT